jgi:hypothetical protein
MHLNLPIYDQLAACKNLLIAGMGGGFDVFCGLPLYFELRERGQTVHLANYSFSEIEHLKGGIRLSDTLVGVSHDLTGSFVYFPEHYLAQWFKEKRGEDVSIWCFHRTGVRPLLENYQTLIDHLHIDGILLIDGGVDSLLRGDEAEAGSFLEDTISLIAVSELENIQTRIIACVGFGAEKNITHAHILENIAELTMRDGFLGSCSLLTRMESYQKYEEATLFVQSNPQQESSVINSSIISAVQGNYGDYHLTNKTRGSDLWISPLMPIYWFFDLQTILERNLLAADLELRWTNKFTQAWQVALDFRQTVSKRKPSKIPL